jgi:hypothetical protein
MAAAKGPVIGTERIVDIVKLTAAPVYSVVLVGLHLLISAEIAHVTIHYLPIVVLKLRKIVIPVPRTAEIARIALQNLAYVVMDSAFIAVSTEFCMERGEAVWRIALVVQQTVGNAVGTGFVCHFLTRTV